MIDAKRIGNLVLSKLPGANATRETPRSKAQPVWNGTSPPEPNGDPLKVYDAARAASDPAYLKWCVSSGLYASVKAAEREAKVAAAQDRAREVAAERADRQKARAEAEQAQADARRKALEAADKAAWDRATG